MAEAIKVQLRVMNSALVRVLLVLLCLAAGLYGATGLSLSAFGSRHRFVVTTSRRNWLELRRDAYCGNYSGDLKGYRQQIWLGELQTPQINGGAQ